MYLGKRSAFKLDLPIFDKFFDRMARAMLFHETGSGYVECKTDWRLSAYAQESDSLPPDLRQFLQIAKRGMLANEIFRWSGWIGPNSIDSLWFLTLYRGVLFKVYLMHNPDQYMIS